MATNQTLSVRNDEPENENVLDRLRRMTRIARQNGFEIRGEPLGGAGSTWCEIRGNRILFLDLTQTAAEQALTIAEILETVRMIRPHAPIPSNTHAARNAEAA